MVDAKSINTPMSINGNLDRDENGKDVDVKRYKGMFGSLLYLTASVYGIMFSVSMCARYQSAIKESHLKVIKRILVYLHGTSKYERWFSKGRDCSLVCYSDSNFSGCKSDRKSISGTCHIFSNSLVSWHIKKQFSIAFPTAEAEYVTVGSCCSQI
ncbi:secreted RxLR effector protein 161-like [Lathyrus oleraceus]|uniref:secreted RxLR effector protein 161-like n=1 Tax=Pisum sativum TaxID=3888 RepID=UPI0021D187E4|nr:secreted RxLR effector protein 161-like [Pisum sativum]